MSIPPAIAWATSLNRTTVARAIATTLRSVAPAIANKCVTKNNDQSNGVKAPAGEGEISLKEG